MTFSFLKRRYIVHFGQVYLSKPVFVEADGTAAPMFPQEARLRNLTYSAPLYVDIKKRTMIADPNDPQNQGIVNVNDMELRQEGDEESLDRVFIGKVPIMLRSTYCILSSMIAKDIPGLGECPFDQVNYLL